MKNDHGRWTTTWPSRKRFFGSHGVFLERAIILVFVVLFARPVAQDPANRVILRTRRAQEFVDELRAALQISSDVQVAAVPYNSLVFSVKPFDATKDRFLLTMEVGFLLMLDDDELRAAMAHELGHVWIYTHRPFLQTERLANQIGERVVDRASFERIYSKLWVYEGASGVSMDELLGPASADPNVPKPVVGDTGP